jgi:hypothetical protein
MFPDFSSACAGLFFMGTFRATRFSLLRGRRCPRADTVPPARGRSAVGSRCAGAHHPLCHPSRTCAGSTREFATTDVAQDCEEPRLDLRAAERVEIAQRAQVAFLRCIVGIRRVVEQVSCQRVNVVEMGQRGVAKTRALSWCASLPLPAIMPPPAFQATARPYLLPTQTNVDPLLAGGAPPSRGR